MLEQLRDDTRRLRLSLSERGEIALQRPTVIKAVECAVRFGLGAALSCAGIFGGPAPFGAAMVAASGGRAEGLAALLGALAGYFISFETTSAIKYAAVSALVYALAFALRDARGFGREWLMPLASAFIFACAGLIYTAAGGFETRAALLYAAEAILLAGTSYFYKAALSPHPADGSDGELKYRVSLLILAATALVAPARLLIADTVSVGRAVAVFAVMTAAWRGGEAAGGAVGAALGAAMDLASFSPVFCGAYALAGMAAGVFRKQGKLMFALAFIAVNAAALLRFHPSPEALGGLYEVFAASVAILLIPDRVLAAWAAPFAGGVSESGARGARYYAASRLQKAADAFRELGEAMSSAFSGGTNDNDISSVFDAAASKVCRKCRFSPRCWNRDYETTANAMNEASRGMVERRSLKREDFPDYFRTSCISPESFASAAETELKNLLRRRRYLERLRENQSVIFSQYLEISSVLGNVAKELSGDMESQPAAEARLQKYLRGLNIDAATAVFRDGRGRLHAEIKSGRSSLIESDPEGLDKLSAAVGARLCQQLEGRESKGRIVLMEAEPLAASVGIASRRRSGESASGDRASYFKTDDGVLCVLLADGVGSGGEAAKESGEALGILERFLRAGIEPETALKILNSVLLARNEDGLACAAIDLLWVDLFSGAAKLFKYGAAPSYVKNGGDAERVRGGSLSAGLSLDGVGAPDCFELVLPSGSLVVLASDGVASPIDDEWLRRAASEYSGGSAKELAMELLETADEKYGGADDMTVLTVFIDKRI